MRQINASKMGEIVLSQMEKVTESKPGKAIVSSVGKAITSKSVSRTAKCLVKPLVTLGFLTLAAGAVAWVLSDE